MSEKIPERDQAAAIHELERRLAESEANLQALILHQIDAVLESGNTTPLLLHQAQAALQRSKSELEALVAERTADLEQANRQLRSELAHRKTLEASLRESEQRYQELVESLPELVWTCLPDGRCDYLSPQWTAYTGLPAEEQLDYGWLEQVHPEDRTAFEAAWQQAVKEGTRFDYEFRLRRADGVYRWFKTQAVALYAENSSIYKWFGTDTDIQFLKEAEERVRQGLALALEAEIHHRLLEQRELERQIIARNLHDGPIQDLIALIYALQEVQSSACEPEISEALREIKISTQGLVSVLRNICNELRPPTLVQFGLERAIRNHAMQLEEKYDVRLSIHLDLMEDGTRLPDSTRLGLYRIYQEAILNVIHHARASHVAVRLLLKDCEATLEVEDDGQGFDLPDDWIEMARSGHLGFVGMKERAEALGGDFTVLSTAGSGTLVHVNVPC